MALPGTFMLDRRGRVTARFFEEFYAERNTTEMVLLRTGAGGSQVQGTKITTGQLEIVTYPSDAEVAPGNRFSLVLDITPRPGMHVYAPGAVGYRAIVLDVGPKPFVQLPAMRFPASEIYHFKPLDERMPVYQKPFRLMQEVVLEGSREAIGSLQGQERLTLTGLLDYQACDEKVCYNPVTIPVSWTVGLKSLVRERPVPAK